MTATLSKTWLDLINIQAYIKMYEFRLLFCRESQKFSFHPPTYRLRSIFFCFHEFLFRCLVVVFFFSYSLKMGLTIKVWKIDGNNELNSLNLDRTINFVSFYFQRINLRDEIHSLTIQTRYLYAFSNETHDWHMTFIL